MVASSPGERSVSRICERYMKPPAACQPNGRADAITKALHILGLSSSLVGALFPLRSGGPAVNRQLLALADETHLGHRFADVTRDRKRHCLSGRERGHEAEWRIALTCLQCHDEAMAVRLHRVIGNPCERAEVDFLSLDRLERIGMKRAADGYRGDCRKQRGSIGHNDLRVGLVVR